MALLASAWYTHIFTNDGEDSQVRTVGKRIDATLRLIAKILGPSRTVPVAQNLRVLCCSALPAGLDSQCIVNSPNDIFCIGLNDKNEPTLDMWLAQPLLDHLLGDITDSGSVATIKHAELLDTWITTQRRRTLR